MAKVLTGSEMVFYNMFIRRISNPISNQMDILFSLCSARASALLRFVLLLANTSINNTNATEKSICSVYMEVLRKVRTLHILYILIEGGWDP